MFKLTVSVKTTNFVFVYIQFPSLTTFLFFPTAFTEQPVFGAHCLTHPEEWKAKAHTPKGFVANLATVGIEGVRYVVGKVVGVEANELVFQDGKRLPFGALVVAVGVHYPAIMAQTGETFAERQTFLESFPNKLKSAKSILIGGGGPVALEVAGTLRAANGQCKIQMVTSGDRALAQWDGTPAAVLAARLKTIKVDVVTNARVENVQASTGVYEKRNYTLSNGKTIENVDIFLPFFAVARTDFLPENLIDSAKRGRVSVNANSQSTVQKNVFAVGCGNRWMVGIDATIKKEAAAVAQNVQDVLDGKAPSISLPEECPATVDYVHIGLGEYTMMNMDQKGCFPTVISRMCGCCFPLCPCCACCGWCCSYPGSECSGKCMGKMLLSMGNMHPVHASKPPSMLEMAR